MSISCVVVSHTPSFFIALKSTGFFIVLKSTCLSPLRGVGKLSRLSQAWVNPRVKPSSILSEIPHMAGIGPHLSNWILFLFDVLHVGSRRPTPLELWRIRGETGARGSDSARVPIL